VKNQLVKCISKKKLASNYSRQTDSNVEQYKLDNIARIKSDNLAYNNILLVTSSL